MIKLRDYQNQTLISLFDYLNSKQGNPCVVSCTGSGKSVIIAAFCKAVLDAWKDSRILILTHQKELIEQDARALKNIWEDAEIGLYSASIGQKCLDMPITYASIQSIYKLQSPNFDIVLVDECHLINNEDKGIYRKFLERVHKRVIGFTATPFRLGQGMIIEEGSIFTDLIECTSIGQLQREGYLAKLTSKGTLTKYDLSNVPVRGGDYVESALQDRLDVYSTNEAVCDEIIKSARAFSRKHWLIFCAGIEHATHIADILKSNGIKAASVTSKMSKDEREEILYRFTQGEIEALTNAKILTTGFDYPEIDLIAMLQPTLSPGLYIQEAGRGLRKKKDGGDCLLLDFAGNVMRHGTITDVKPPKKKGESSKLGTAPMKECPKCLEILPTSTRICPACGYEFPKNDQLWALFNGDVNGDELSAYPVYSWLWMIKQSRKSGKDMITADYVVHQGALRQVTEYYCVFHEGWAGENAQRHIMEICKETGTNPAQHTWQELIDEIAAKEPPAYILVEDQESNGRKYKRIVQKIWQYQLDKMTKEMNEQEELRNETRKHLYS